MREPDALGYTNLSRDDLVRLRNHGVTSAFVRELETVGIDRPGVDDLISLRDQGVTADNIRTSNLRAAAQRLLDLIKAALASGKSSK